MNIKKHIMPFNLSDKDKQPSFEIYCDFSIKFEVDKCLTKKLKIVATCHKI